MSKSNKSILMVAAIGLIAIATGIFVQQSQTTEASPPEFSKVIILPKSKVITGVDFIDHNGEKFDIERLRDKWSVVFFGFTNCPDICPTTLHTLKQVKAKLADNDHADFYQVLMVSVDPARDTIEQLANYVPFFDPSFIGLRASIEITTEFAKQLGILFIAQDEKGDGGYDVDHGTSLILINPKGEMAGVIPAPHSTDEVSSDLGKLADYYTNQSSTQDTNTNLPKTIVAGVATTSNDQLLVSNAWIRPAPVSAKSMAAYLTIRNNREQAITLTGVSSEQFAMAMIHQTVVKDGTASMQHLDSLTIDANDEVILSPMGIHLMLVKPKSHLKLGDKAVIELITEDGVSFAQEIEVKEQP